MIKADLTRLVADDVGINRALAQKLIDTSIKLIINSLGSEGRVQLLGFGTFILKIRKGRAVKLPMSNKKVEFPDRYVIKFIPGKRFLQRLNRSARGSL